MPHQNIWIRKEDWSKWLAIESKSEWLHEKLSGVSASAVEVDLKDTFMGRKRASFDRKWYALHMNERFLHGITTVVKVALPFTLYVLLAAFYPLYAAMVGGAFLMIVLALWLG